MWIRCKLKMLGWDGMWREEERKRDEETNRYRDAVLARLPLVTVVGQLLPGNQVLRLH